MNSKLSRVLFWNILVLFLSAGAGSHLAAQETATSGTGIVTPGETTSVSATTSASGGEKPINASDATRLFNELGASSATGTVGGVVGSGPGVAETRPIFDISDESNAPDSVTRDPSQKNIPIFSLDTPVTEPGVPQGLKDIGKTPALDLDSPQSESTSKPLNQNVSPVVPLEGGPALPTADETVAPGAEVAPAAANPQETETSTSDTTSSALVQPDQPQSDQGMKVPLLGP